jgi:GT2 family glycosyltransferase
MLADHRSVGRRLVGRRILRLPLGDWRKLFGCEGLRRLAAETSYMVDLSVVVASVNGWPPIRDCLSSLERQEGGLDYEVIVAVRRQDETGDLIRRQFPRVKVVRSPERVGIPALRAIAMSEARGGIIAVTEDHCIAPADWFQEIYKAHQSGCMVVGGAVENGMTKRILDWSVFFCEYSSAMSPVRAGEVDGIPGNNAAYKREALQLVDDRIKRNFWEFFLHEELKRKGVKLISVPSIVVIHKKQFGFFYFISQRFHYSRSFAGMRRSLLSRSRRFLYVFASPLLPVLMGARLVRDVFFEKKRLYREFILSAPSLSAFLVSYAFGEFLGYLIGPGSSLSKVE